MYTLFRSNSDNVSGIGQDFLRILLAFLPNNRDHNASECRGLERVLVAFY